MMLFSVLKEAATMRTTVTIEETTYARAVELTGIKERSALLDEALRTLIARECPLRLARLGGSDPDAAAPGRRRDAA
jgi:Arc/MetJ family transcription regulator